MNPTLARTPADKTALRRTLIAWREALAPNVRLAAEEAIAAHVLALATQYPVRCVGAYWPIRGEPRIDAVWAALRAQHITLALPVVHARHAPLQFHEWDGLAPTMVDTTGVAAPLETPVVAPLDVVVVPCVGYQAQGYRLGYGGGYFDRTLAALTPRPYTIGVAFAGQLCQFEIAPHDVRLDAIVTEHGGLMLAEMTPPD